MSRPAKKKADDSHHLHKNPKALTITLIGAILGLFVFSWIYGTSYTGYVNVDLNTVHIDEMAFDGTRLVISSEDGMDIPMGAARISGRIYGEGNVRVYLVSKERRFLVFSNTNSPGAFSIDIEPRGMIDRSVLLDSSSFSFSTGPERNLWLGIIEDESKMRVVDVDYPAYVRSACMETCRLHGSVDNNMYVFLFEMDDGVAFEVTDIGFS